MTSICLSFGDEDKMFGTDLKSFAPHYGFAISELSANWLKRCTAQSMLLILWHTMLMVSNLCPHSASLPFYMMYKYHDGQLSHML